MIRLIKMTWSSLKLLEYQQYMNYDISNYNNLIIVDTNDHVFRIINMLEKNLPETNVNDLFYILLILVLILFLRG